VDNLSGDGFMVCWVTDLGRVDYQMAMDLQTELVALRLESKVPDIMLLLEHPHVYTFGRRIDPSHLLFNDDELDRWGINLFPTDRGGDITYHGPGQLIGYLIMDIGGIHQIKDFLTGLEEVLIRTAADFGINADRIPGYPGVWFGAEKLASIGIRVSKGVTKHGFALNVTTDLSYFCGIVPCGLHDIKMTSIAKILGREVSFRLVEGSVIRNFSDIFGVDMMLIKKDDLFELGRAEGWWKAS
jgi:lipoyl(octanoyl) transferase